jgi:NADH-quinone oxidoreductase subunit I
MNLFDEIRDAVKGLYSLAVGMGVTGKYFVKPQVTVHYPRKTVDNVQTYSGHVELLQGKKNPAESDCILCGTCERNCPSGCLTIQYDEIVEENPEPEKKKKKTKKLTAFIYDYSYCSLCGQCVENCPVDTLGFSNHVYWAEFDRSKITLDLLARLREKLQNKRGA